MEINYPAPLKGRAHWLTRRNVRPDLLLRQVRAISQLLDFERLVCIVLNLAVIALWY